MKHGLTSAEHQKIDVSDAMSPAYEFLKTLDHPTVLDIGGGGGRDITAMYNFLGGQGRFINMDYDPQRARDAQSLHPDMFIVTSDASDLKPITDQDKIAYIVNDVLRLDLPEDMKADFILSLALTMFITEESLENYAEAIVDNIKPGGRVFHSHSIDRPVPTDPEKSQYPNGYHHHSVSKLTDIFEKLGCEVQELEPTQDGRGFDWYRLNITAP